MKDVLLVGEDQLFLKIMALELRFKGLNTRRAHDSQSLQQALAEREPELVVFHHIGPIDLFFLNPREYGYDGPLLLLVDHGDPVFSREHVRAHSVLLKPFVVQTVYRELTLIIR